MHDPTEFVLTSGFLAALGIFTITSIARKFLRRSPEDPVPFEEIPHDGESPYSPPVNDGFEEEPPEEKVPTWFYRASDLIGVGLIFLVFFGLVIGSVRAAEKAEVTLDPGGLIASIGFQFVIAGLVTMTVIRRIRPSEWLGLHWRSWPWVFLIAPGAVITMWSIFAALQFSGYTKWMESLGVESVQETVKLLQTATDPLILGLMAFAAVIAAPICEEIVFRGYLYPATKRFAGPWAAGICSALIFASAHGSLSALLPLFIFGCVLVFVYEKTGSLWAPIAVHFCFNGATVLIQMAVRFGDLPLDSLQ